MTIRQKLTAIIMLTSAVILLLAITVFVIWGQIEARRQLVDDLRTHADIIADSCKASLAFSDKGDAEQILSALHARGSMVFACIYDKQGQIFVEYQRQDITEKIQLPEPQEDSHSFEHGYLSVFQQIKLDGEMIGTVYLRDDMSKISASLMWNIVVAISTLLFVMVVAYLLSSKLQKAVSGPILSLAEVAKDVSEKKDYSVRAVKQSSDEVGWLIETFNEMLEQIQLRDLELVNSKAQLEIKVQERTAELSSVNTELEGEVEQRTAAQGVLEKRIKELNCLFSLSKLVERPEIPLGAIFQDTTELIRMAYQYPDFTCIRITCNGVKYQTDNFDKSELSQHAEIRVAGEKAGIIEVYYLGEKAESDESPFLKEERELIDTIAEHLGRIAGRKKTGEKLQLFRNLIDQSSDSIFVIDPKWGRLLDMNGAACKNLGYTREELLKMTIKDFDDSFPDDASWNEHAEKIRRKGSVVFEGISNRKDGTTFPVEVNAKLIKQGKEEFIIGVARDITERKQAEEAIKKSESKYRTLLENIPQKVFLKDRDSVYISCNESYANDLGIKSEEIAGKTDYEFYPKELADKYKEDDQKVIRSEQRLDIDESYIQNGHESIVHTVKTPVKDEQGNVSGVLGIFWDITALKLAEERQAELLKQVESANRELKDFAYIVSHDLKAPLRGIKTIANWISTDYAVKLDEDGREQLGLLVNRVDRMNNLIDGVLQYSRVGRIKEKRIKINLNELVPEIVDTIAPPENIQITVENGLPVVECEETRILQVFQNLLSNAVKYMDKPQGRIKIGCVQEDGFWKFSVADNGPGIEEAHFEKIFQIFQTLSPRDEVESTGVGLSVVKKIVELYGGKIWVESKPGEGSVFFFTLPKPESEVIDDEKLEANIVS